MIIRSFEKIVWFYVYRPSSNGPIDFAWISVIVVSFISLIAFKVKSETPRSLNESKLSDVRWPPDGIKEPIISKYEFFGYHIVNKKQWRLIIPSEFDVFSIWISKFIR